MQILFLTTHNLASNPRLVKEIKLALENNYRVTIICFTFRNWSFTMNEELMVGLKNQGVVIHSIEAGREEFIPWILSIAKERWCRVCARYIPLNGTGLSNAVSRRSSLLLNNLKKIKQSDLIVGHNPGALWATVEAGKKFHCKMGFDMEDYHAGEGNNKHLQSLTKTLLQKVLPKLNYVSFAAPLIMEEVESDIGYKGDNWFTILNYFPSEEFTLPEKETSGPLKLVWFSQNINFGRGLELVLPSVQSRCGKVELHLYGHVNTNFRHCHLEGINNIFLHGTLPQKQLHKELFLYDIGLALEPSKDRNNNLAISNKLLTYLQAGLYVIATRTKGQQSFMCNFPDMGIYFDYEKDDFTKVLESIINRVAVIRSARKERFEEFQNNWATESATLLKAFGNLKQQ